jgi:uncharacterized protein
MSDKTGEGRVGGVCPMCGAPSETRYRPFCSRRCSHLDLANWLNEEYTMPVSDEAAPELPSPANDHARSAED